MLDMMANAADPIQYLRNFGLKGKQPMPFESHRLYICVRCYMLHAPVLRKCPSSGKITIVPLNPLPDGVNIAECLEMPELRALSSNVQLLESVYKCSVLPMTRGPLENKAPPAARGCSTPCSIFGILDFNMDPVRVQPTICVVNWLRARNIDACLSHPRSEIERLVNCCLDLQKPVSPPMLLPIVGQHDGYFAIRPRSGVSSEENNWSTIYVDTVKRCEPISDAVVDGLLGEKRRVCPSIRCWVKLLVTGGFYKPKSIKWKKDDSTKDGTPCVLFCINCLSSKTSVLHTVYAVFKDKLDGKYMLDLSSCSCKKGQWFCSHSIGFLYIMAIIQQKVTTEKEFASKYCINPALITGVLMLMKNMLVSDTFRRQKAHRKR